MTTIVVDFKNGLIGADTQETVLGVKAKCHKLVRLEDGSIVGCAGDSGSIDLFVEHLKSDSQFKMPKNQYLEVLFVNPDGKVFITVNGSPPSELSEENEFFAIGSGAQYAMGAMKAGADIHKALEIAATFDVYTSGPFEVENFKDE